MKYNKIIFSLAVAVLVAGFIFFIFEKLHVTNFYEKPIITTSSDSPRAVNSVDYTQQTSPPDPSINSEKNPVEKDASNKPGDVSITITRANQDSTTKNINIGVLVTGATTGICKLELIQNNQSVVVKDAELTTQSGLTTCNGFTVLDSEIPNAGASVLKITVGNTTTSRNMDLTR